MLNRRPICSRPPSIRGGKRHLRYLEQLSSTAAPFSGERLSRYGYDYAKLGLGPWHWHHRQPPQRVRQLAVRHLLATFFDWQRVLQAQSPPCYLAIWLVAGREFAHASQVVTASNEKGERYRHLHGAPNPAGPPLPPEYGQLPGARELTWTTHPWKIGLDEFDYPTGWPAGALARPHERLVFEDGSRHLLVQTSWVWVGQRAAAAGSAR